MSDSYFDSDTELYSGKRSSQYNEFVVNDIESLDLYQSIVSGYYIDEQKYVWNFFFSRSKARQHCFIALEFTSRTGLTIGW